MKKFTSCICNNANSLVLRARTALSNQRGDFYISDAVKIIIAVVLGALLLAALTLCLRGQEPRPIPIEDETSPLYAELDAFITMIKRRGGNEGYLSISLATCRVLDEIAKQNKITFRQTCWNMVVHRDD